MKIVIKLFKHSVAMISLYLKLSVFETMSILYSISLTFLLYCSMFMFTQTPNEKIVFFLVNFIHRKKHPCIGRNVQGFYEIKD